MRKSPPPNGSEHIFTMKRWDGPVGRGNNNCYAYAMNDYKIMMFVSTCKPTSTLCHGDFHFYKQHSKTEYKIKRGDTHEIIAKFFKVPVTRIKRAAKVLLPGKVITFKAEFFSHKRGWATGPLTTGATGKLIKDPRTTSRKYPGMNYNKYCGSFCIKNGGVKVGHTHPKVRK